MPFKGQRIPSQIFLVGSSVSLASAADEPETPSPRRFSRLSLDAMLAKSKAPSLPKRQSSRGMSFRKNSSFFGRNNSSSNGGKMNATFDLRSPSSRGGSSNKASLFEKFSTIAPMLSPGLSESSRKTKASIKSTDTPLTMPRRKASHQTFSVPLHKR